MRRSVSMRKNQFEFKEKDFIHCNWLKKQGGKFKTLKRRYFVLVKNVLYYFTNQNRTVLKGQINLKNLELSELEEDKASCEYNFHILPEKNKNCVNESHIKYLLSTNDKKDAEKWIFHLKQAMYLEKGGGLFGTPLCMVMPYLKQEYCYVPRIIFECCQFIRSRGMEEEGIFRKNGQLSLVLQMKEMVDRAIYDWEEADIHTVCSLLKLYLRELPEPLIPFCHYDGLKAVGYRIDAQENLGLVRDKLSMLPMPNLQLLKYLCEFLTEVSSHSENRMEISSLAKIFSPNILRDQDTDPYVEESTNIVITVTVAAFIKSQDDLFQFEYEPLVRFEEEPRCEDQDTYSLKSAVSYFTFRNSLVPDEDTTGSAASLPHIPKSPTRVQSMYLASNIFTEWARSQDTIDNTMNRPMAEVIDYSEKTPLSSKRFPLSNGIVNSNDNTLPSCSGCLDLMKQLSTMREERDRIQRSYDIIVESSKHLKEEIEYLKSKLIDNKVLQPENIDDFSDILKHFNCNKL